MSTYQEGLDFRSWEKMERHAHAPDSFLLSALRLAVKFVLGSISQSLPHHFAPVEVATENAIENQAQ